MAGLIATCLASLTTPVAAPAPTRVPGMPPGWRAEPPSEEGGVIVARMLRRVQRVAGVEPGNFFDEYNASMRAMAATNEALLPATQPGDLVAHADDDMRAKMRQAASGLKWQQRMVEQLPDNATLRAAEVSEWPLDEVIKILDACAVVNSTAGLLALAAAKQRATAKDLVSLLRLFAWMDKEAHQITKQTSAERGSPPPSAPPPPQPRAPAPASRRRKGKRRRRSAPKDEV